MTADESNEARAEHILVECSAELLRYFQRRVRPEEDAADLLSELSMTAWRKRKAIPRSDEEARMWLYGVARNTLRNWQRGQRRHRDNAARLRDEIRAHSSAPPLDEVREAIARLPVNQAELVRLIHWDGFSVVDAARALEISESTARGRYQRARIKLAQDPSITDLRHATPASPSTGQRTDHEVTGDAISGRSGARP